MAKGATSLVELKAQIEEAVTVALNDDVANYIKQKLISHANSDIYGVNEPDPWGYHRRYSFLDENQYLIEDCKSMSLVLTPKQVFNTNFSGTDDSIKKSHPDWLAGLINYGNGWSGVYYDYYVCVHKGPWWLPARPFLDNTVEELENGELGDQLLVSLKKRGFNVK